MTIEEFGRRLRAREVTAEQVTEECLERIKADNPRLNAFILVMDDEARRHARQADREIASGRDRGPLHGVPMSVKDLIDVRDTPTTASLVDSVSVASSSACSRLAALSVEAA